MSLKELLVASVFVIATALTALVMVPIDFVMKLAGRPYWCVDLETKRYYPEAPAIFGGEYDGQGESDEEAIRRRLKDMGYF